MERRAIEANDKYQAALARADAKGYAVTAVVSNKSGVVIGCVVTGPQSKHNVIVDAQFLLCDCIAADHDVICVHVAVSQRKLMQRAAEAAQMTKVIEQRSTYKASVTEWPAGQDNYSVDEAMQDYDEDTTTHADAISAETETLMRGSEMIIMRNQLIMGIYR